jgi:hypothetical protein
MFRDKIPTFKMSCRLARWLCASPDRARRALGNKDTMKRLQSIHAVLTRKAKLGGSGHGKKKPSPAAAGAVAIAALLHTIKDNGSAM